MKSNIQITFSGLIRSPASWATISRHLIKELSRQKVSLKLIPKRGFLYASNFPMKDSFQSLVDSPVKEEESVSLCFDHPRFYPKLKGKVKSALLVYETFPVPPEWINLINDCLDILFVPGLFNQDLFIKSGANPNKIRILPYGCHHCSASQKRKRFTEKQTRFLTLAMPHKRKAVSFLIKSFCHAFTKSDDVSLTIKTTYRPKPPGKRFSWETAPVQEMIKRIRSGFPHSPEIRCEESILSDTDMLSFLDRFDIYVQPSFAEGFGLAIMEAMNAGLPCIVTGYGGHMDFCSSRNSLLIPYSMKYRKGMAYDDAMSKERTLVALPDMSAFIDLLRFSHTHKKRCRKLSLQASRDIAPYTWENSAGTLLNHLKSF